MEFEKEIKILDVNTEEIEKKLLSLGAEKIFEGEIDTLFFDFEGEYISKKNAILRLRKLGEESFLCLKKSLKTEVIKEMEEIEVKISDFEKMVKIIEFLGMKNYERIKKFRKSYLLNGVRIELERHIDNYSYIPDFIEIEGDNSEKIFEIIKILGYKKEETKPWTIFNVIEYYKKDGN